MTGGHPSALPVGKPAPSRTMPCGFSLACSPESIEVTLYPRLLFTYSNLLAWLSVRGLVGKRGAGITCSAAGLVANTGLKQIAVYDSDTEARYNFMGSHRDMESWGKAREMDTGTGELTQAGPLQWCLLGTWE